MGLAILANSRPFEGFGLGLPVLVLLLAAAWKQNRLRRLPALAPLAAVLALTAAGMGYYNWRNTGDPLKLPYLANRNQYAAAGLMIFDEARTPPPYRHQVMRNFYIDVELKEFAAGKEMDFPTRLLVNLLTGMFFVGVPLAPALLASHRVVRDRRVRPLLIVCGTALLFQQLSAYSNPHYMSPYLGIFLAVLLQGLRHLRRSGRAFPVLIGRAAPVVSVLTVVLQAVMPAGTSTGAEHWSRKRAAMLRELKASPDRHLILVRYTPDHNPIHMKGGEWVYNEADIDGAKVVWARAMSPEKDAELVRYFRGRKVWLLEPDVEPVTLKPYPAAPPG
jgi:4-amino-4-deoxy-L-arabinose transferase-like glycosyltransferase